MEDKNIVLVGMAEIKISHSPNILATRGLGSCVGITLYDYIKKIGGLAHPMLPDDERAKIKSNPAKFVNSAIKSMLEELKHRGSFISRLEAKIFGGAHMFAAIPPDSRFNIGIKNVEKAKEILTSLRIKIAGEDTGGGFGRTVELDLVTGKATVKTIFYGQREL